MVPHIWATQAADSHAAVIAATTGMMRNRVPQSPYYSDLLALADALIKEGRYELAVVVAQMACEVVVEQTLTERRGRRKAPPNYNLRKNATRQLYEQLTRDTIRKQSFWKAYGCHVDRRDKVVHHGKRVDPSDARDSITTAHQFVEHVDTVRRTAR
jgi:hypothetical protein